MPDPTNQPLLKSIRPDDLAARAVGVVDPTVLEQARAIIDDVRARGLAAVKHHAHRLGDHDGAAPLIYSHSMLEQALARIGDADRAVLERTAARISRFAQAQRATLSDLNIGGLGHRFTPVERAGCYAPGGRFPLPSSVLMTAVTAHVAGVREVVVASPKPRDVTLAAAAVAGADRLLAVGGAQAIAWLAFGGGEIPPCDIIVGPGNKWVTAAKQLVFGQVGIDMLAGPSEVLILADATADPDLIASDLLAQAEHDDDAVPMLIATSQDLIVRVNASLDKQLHTLPTQATARRALCNGFAILAASLAQAIDLCNTIGPEHLEVFTEHPESVASQLTNFGGLFIGPKSAEVLADYGVGPNHVLPTAGTSRFSSGLSVLNFLRIRTFCSLDPASDADGYRALVRDCVALARMEGLEAHARAAERRLHQTEA